MRTLVAGIDCSTQSTKVLVCDAATGQVVRSGSAPHPDVTEIDPAVWAAALESASSGGLLDDVAAISVGGQQHGMVALDEAGEVVRPALLWNDTRSARAATELIAELGGPEKWAEAVGSSSCPKCWLRPQWPGAPPTACSSPPAPVTTWARRSG